MKINSIQSGNYYNEILLRGLFMKLKFKEELVNYLFITLGTVFFVVGIRAFIIPAKLSTGGVNGIAIILHYLFNQPVGLLIIIFNIPLFILGWRTVEHDFTIKTFYAVVLSSILIGPLNYINLVNEKEMILGAIYGGIVYGLGIGIVFRFGGSLGGIDIIAKYINKQLGISIGILNLFINGIIIILAGIVIGKTPAMYTLIGIFVASKVLDTVQEGLPTKSIFIVSDKSELIIKAIINQTGRGVTILKGLGAYTNDEKKIILTAVHWEDLYKIKKIIKETDPFAFIIVGNAKEILGKGFAQI